MGTSAAFARCAQCGGRFRQRTEPGRKKNYCTTSCRRRAQRLRDREALAAPPPAGSSGWGRQVADDGLILAARLAEAERMRMPLTDLLAHADRLSRNAASYMAAAVQDARTAGTGWAAVAQAAGVSVETARTKWNEQKVKRLLARRDRHWPAALRQAELPRGAPEASAQEQPLPGRTAAMEARLQLAAALTNLQRKSAVTLQEAAQQADLSPSYVSRVLAGSRLPTWPVVYMLATIFSGNAGDLKSLWERAHGACPPRRHSVAGAAARLQSALRGLYLAAGEPDLPGLAEGGGPSLTAEAVQEVLDGDLIPDWWTVEALVVRMGGDAAFIRPLWEDLHYVFLASRDVFPEGGLPRSGLPGTEPDAGAGGPAL
ncbi:helix-turn-helix domain-containing protein [Streptomyces sp. NPDC059474]|uniref:helix-turn-helix domain-containing protein n=1 Tax=Streptomyces sp. NPDC059474 TaxID=3346846 RepID=UPI0036BD2291